MKAMIFAALALVLVGTQASAQDRGYERQAPPPPTPDNVKFAWADVLRVDPVYERVPAGSAHEECEDVPADHRADNGNRAAGTVLGAIVGGVLGSTVGKGDGRTVATVAGAVAGGAVGNNIARNNDQNYPTTQHQCRMVQDAPDDRRIVAYDVQYRYRGDVYMSRLNYDPGDRLRVRVSIGPAE
jgi:uncharacterized protein YcfJ